MPYERAEKRSSGVFLASTHPGEHFQPGHLARMQSAGLARFAKDCGGGRLSSEHIDEHRGPSSCDRVIQPAAGAKALDICLAVDVASAPGAERGIDGWEICVGISPRTVCLGNGIPNERRDRSTRPCGLCVEESPFLDSQGNLRTQHDVTLHHAAYADDAWFSLEQSWA